jgi:uncharacterized protein YeaO (DUF488 family)
MTTSARRSSQAIEAESRVSMNIKIRRVYEQRDKDDGMRILVDRLWPRGLRKEMASVDLWMKEIAPSTELRKWFAHDPDKWKSFRGRYETELRHKDDLIKVLMQNPGKERSPFSMEPETKNTMRH